jgi:hypothetical protein
VRVVAGLDIGNSTTEAVLARVRPGGGLVVLSADRIPARGPKGSADSLDAAAALLRRMERSCGEHATLAVAAPLRPVITSTALAEPPTVAGRVRIIWADAATTAGDGIAVGPPVPLRVAVTAPPAQSAIIVVPADTGYAPAAAALGPLMRAGRVAAVLLERDEAVLLANRLGNPGLPVVDEVPVGRLDDAALVAVECRPAGRLVRRLCDPIFLASALGLSPDDQADAAAVGRRLQDAHAAVVAAVPAAAPVPPWTAGQVETADGGQVPLDGASDLPVGQARAYLPSGGVRQAVEDIFAVSLERLAGELASRPRSLGSQGVAFAALQAGDPVDPRPGLEQRLGLEVRLAPSEGTAARSGALATPGAQADAAVLDLGGGTIDVITSREEVVAAGGGDLLTVIVAALLAISRSAAEWAKRGPSRRLEAPQLMMTEDGGRVFLDTAVSADLVGTLAVAGPAGLLPFDRVHAPAEWRALRLRAKALVLGHNVARALGRAGARPRQAVLVGGPAGDDEALAAVTAALPGTTAVGRGDVAGLGHRYAVAYGLIRQCLQD